MMLIIDSGSTKAHWRVVNKQSVVAGLETTGINPLRFEQGAISTEIKEEVDNNIANPLDINRIYFYGAGCISTPMEQKVSSLLSEFFPRASIFVSTDMLGAARAVFGHKTGLVVILGTGSNAAYYNGETIERKTPALGYLLGDEGSGAYLGKMLLRAWFYNELSSEIDKALLEYVGMPKTEVLTRVYAQNRASAYLASFVPFIADNISNSHIEQMVLQAFTEFVDNHLVKYPNLSSTPVGVVGSVGFVFRKQFLDIANKKGVLDLKFLQFPIDGLVAYHIENE